MLRIICEGAGQVGRTHIKPRWEIVCDINESLIGQRPWVAGRNAVASLLSVVLGVCGGSFVYLQAAACFLHRHRALILLLLIVGVHEVLCGRDGVMYGIGHIRFWLVYNERIVRHLVGKGHIAHFGVQLRIAEAPADHQVAVVIQFY